MADVIDPDSPRYARQRVLPGFGAAGQRRLAAAHVVVLGAGGLGSAVVPVLVAAGVGRLTIVDDDRVDVTNLHRQLLHAPADVGRTKVASAADAAAALSPETTVRPVPQRFTAENADELLADADLVIDGTDDLPTLYVADDAAARAGIPLVWGSAARFSGQVGVSWEERGVSYRDLFPEPPADAGLSCEIDGILPTVCTVTGGMMAGEALKLLTGIGEPLVGRVLVYDALSGRTREIAYRRAGSAGRVADEASGGRVADEASGGRVVDEASGGRVADEGGVPRPDAGSRDGAGAPPRPTVGAGAPPRPTVGAPPRPTVGAGAPARPAGAGAPTRPAVEAIEAAALAAELASGAPPLLLDVREPWEAQVAAIAGSVLIPLGELGDRVGELDSAASVVVYCHLGVRSQYAAEQLAGVGFGAVRNLAGGIDAWSRIVDPAVARY